MNGYYEKQEARRERLEARIEKAHAASHAHYEAAMSELRVIPMGQPILVGHHSERAHRALIARSDRHMEKSHDLNLKAARLEDKLAGFGKGGISSDAPDAVELLEKKLADLEAKHQYMLDLNKKTPKGEPKPVWPYQLQNSRARINATKKRIEELKKKLGQSTTEREFEGGRIVDNVEENRLQIFFDDKPEADIRTQLKQHGFRWAPSVGAWQRMRSPSANFAVKQLFPVEEE